MNVINKIFTLFFSIQCSIDRIENLYTIKWEKIRKWIWLTFVVGIILLSSNQEIIGMAVLCIGIIAALINTVIGWRYSVGRWIRVCILGNFFFSALLTLFLRDINKNIVFNIMFEVIYFTIWMFLSLISNSKVAMLVNEIIGGAATTIFTIGTYILSMKLKYMPDAEEYLEYFSTNGAFETAAKDGDTVAWKLISTVGMEMLEMEFLKWLPIIGVTSLCVLILKVKVYWME